MENNIDIKDIWSKQSIPKIDYDELVHSINRYHKKEKNKIIIANIVLSITSAIILWIGLYFRPDYLSTKAGIILCILAMLIYLFQINKNRKYYKALDVHSSNQDFLAHLVEIKTRMSYVQNQLMNLYFALLGLGLMLYLYEYTIRMPLGYGVLCYALTIAWIIFNWTYIRKRQVLKSNQKLNALIDKVKSQLSN